MCVMGSTRFSLCNFHVVQEVLPVRYVSRTTKIIPRGSGSRHFCKVFRQVKVCDIHTVSGEKCICWALIPDATMRQVFDGIGKIAEYDAETDHDRPRLT